MTEQQKLKIQKENIELINQIRKSFNEAELDIDLITQALEEANYELCLDND